VRLNGRILASLVGIIYYRTVKHRRVGMPEMPSLGESASFPVGATPLVCPSALLLPTHNSLSNSEFYPQRAEDQKKRQRWGHRCRLKRDQVGMGGIQLGLNFLCYKYNTLILKWQVLKHFFEITPD